MREIRGVGGGGGEREREREKSINCSNDETLRVGKRQMKTKETKVIQINGT